MWAPTLSRSVRLFREFGFEQSDPDRFYGALADDSVAQLKGYVDLAGTSVLDVGGGPGYFCDAFEASGATYFSLDADAGELAGRGKIGPRTVMGSGMVLPFRDGAFDVCYSSNVLEHVQRPWQMAGEMVRVTRPGGLVFLSYTTWYGPWGGHEAAPWHFLGGKYAARRYTRRHGHPPKNEYGRSLFKVTVRDALRWVDSQDHVDVLGVFPRYHPRWGWGVIHLPVLRELITWNLAIVLRRR